MENYEVVIVHNEQGQGKREGFVSYEVVKLRDWESLGGERLLTHSFTMDMMRKLMGKTLTIIDSSIENERQNKAMKDLVRQVFSEQLSFSSQMAFDQKEIQKLAEEQMPENIDELETVSIDEVLGIEE